MKDEIVVAGPSTTSSQNISEINDTIENENDALIDENKNTEILEKIKHFFLTTVELHPIVDMFLPIRFLVLSLYSFVDVMLFFASFFPKRDTVGILGVAIIIGEICVALVVVPVIACLALAAGFFVEIVRGVVSSLALLSEVFKAKKEFRNSTDEESARFLKDTDENNKTQNFKVLKSKLSEAEIKYEQAKQAFFEKGLEVLIDTVFVVGVILAFTPAAPAGYILMGAAMAVNFVHKAFVMNKNNLMVSRAEILNKASRKIESNALDSSKNEQPNNSVELQPIENVQRKNIDAGSFNIVSEAKETKINMAEPAANTAPISTPAEDGEASRQLAQGKVIQISDVKGTLFGNASTMEQTSVLASTVSVPVPSAQ